MNTTHELAADVFRDSPAHEDPSTSSGSSPPTKTINSSSSSRHWYLEKKGRFTPSGNDAQTLLVLDEISGEVGCTEAEAALLLKADRVRTLDHLEIPALVGHHVTPGGHGGFRGAVQVRPQAP